MMPERPKESPLGAAIRKVREGPNPADMIQAFNDGKFGCDTGIDEWPETPAYASDLTEWDALARDFYNARNLNATREPTPWNALPEKVRSGWRLAAHDYYWPLARQQGRPPSSTRPVWEEARRELVEGTACGNVRHPRGPWHPASPLPASWQWGERLTQWYRRRKYGCGCKP